MANTQIMSDEPDFFLDYLLRAALTAPGAASSPVAGRILARLLVVGAIEGGDELITGYLVPHPDAEATFDVRTYQPGDLMPTEVRQDLRPAAALKLALRSARDSDDGIEVVSRTETGLERCVLVRDSTGDFEFRFAGSETLIGDAEECRIARIAWDATFAEWRSEVQASWGGESAVPSVERPQPVLVAPPIWAEAPVAPTPVFPATPVSPIARSGDDDRTDGLPGWWRRGNGDDEPQLRWPAAPVGGVAEPDQDDDDSEFAPGPDSDGAPEIELDAASRATKARGDADRAVETVPESELESGLELESELELELGAEPEPAVAESGPVADPGAAARATAAPGPGPGPGSGLNGDAGQLASAIREAIGSVTVEVDLSQVEHLIRRVLDDDRRDMVEPLARRLSARIGEAIEVPDTRSLVDAISQIVPRPIDLAEAVAAEVGALLSETVLRRHANGSGPNLDSQHLAAGLEQLQVRLDGLQDHLERSTGILQAMGEHLAAGDRRAAVAERITTSVDFEIQRLASRIDEQVTALAATAGGGSELADGIARLTRKLRQSVAQFDRAVARVNEMIDEGDSNRTKRPAIAPVAEPPGLGRPPRPPRPDFPGVGVRGPIARG